MSVLACTITDVMTWVPPSVRATGRDTPIETAATDATRAIAAITDFGEFP
jgi:hypothetical protein